MGIKITKTKQNKIIELSFSKQKSTFKTRRKQSVIESISKIHFSPYIRKNKTKLDIFGLCNQKELKHIQKLYRSALPLTSNIQGRSRQSTAWNPRPFHFHSSKTRISLRYQYTIYLE